ncbi:MAG: hypothetical protein R3B68_09770 [Phycisphaerales bacterium]
MAQAASEKSEKAGDDLADQIDSLLSDLDTSDGPKADGTGADGTEGGGAAVAGQEPEADAGADELTDEQVESLAAQIDDLVDEVDRAARGASEPEVADPVEAAGAGEEDSPEAEGAASVAGDEAAAGEGDEAEAIDPAVADPTAPAGADGGDEAAPDLAAPDLAGLDEHLAAAAVVAEHEPDDLIASAAILAPDPSAGRASGFESVEDIGDEPEAAPVEATPAAPAAKASAKVRFDQVLDLALRGARAGVGAGLAWSSKAYARAPAVVQDTIGWIGLVTVFFAGCLWVSVLFFRGTPAPEVYGAPSAVLEPGDPTPQGRPRPRAAQEPDGGSESGDGEG